MAFERGIKLGFELLAVGLGVFLGLLADNWRDQRNERSAGFDVLALVREDLRSDSTELESLRGSLMARAELGPFLLRNRTRSEPPDSAAGFLGSLQTLPRYQRIRPAYEAVRGTGRLDLIEDAELRSELVSYFERTQEQFVQEMSDWLDVRELLIAEYNEYWIFSASDTLQSVFQGPDDIDYTFDWPALTGDRAATTVAVRYSGLAAVTARRSGFLLEANAALGRSIDAALSGR